MESRSHRYCTPLLQKRNKMLARVLVREWLVGELGTGLIGQVGMSAERCWTQGAAGQRL